MPALFSFLLSLPWAQHYLRIHRIAAELGQHGSFCKDLQENHFNLVFLPVLGRAARSPAPMPALGEPRGAAARRVPPLPGTNCRGIAASGCPATPRPPFRRLPGDPGPAASRDGTGRAGGAPRGRSPRRGQSRGASCRSGAGPARPQTHRGARRRGAAALRARIADEDGAVRHLRRGRPPRAVPGRAAPRRRKLRQGGGAGRPVSARRGGHGAVALRAGHAGAVPRQHAQPRVPGARRQGALRGLELLRPPPRVRILR